jgi:hypothetical protein
LERGNLRKLAALQDESGVLHREHRAMLDSVQALSKQAKQLLAKQSL